MRLTGHGQGDGPDDRVRAARQDAAEAVATLCPPRARSLQAGTVRRGLVMDVNEEDGDGEDESVEGQMYRYYSEYVLTGLLLYFRGRDAGCMRLY